MRQHSLRKNRQAGACKVLLRRANVRGSCCIKLNRAALNCLAQPKVMILALFEATLLFWKQSFQTVTVAIFKIRLTIRVCDFSSVLMDLRQHAVLPPVRSLNAKVYKNEIDSPNLS